MLLAVLILSLVQNNPAKAIVVADGGFCSGLAWISVANNEGLTVDEGPDFRVYRYDGSIGDWWGIYFGRFAQVANGDRRRLFSREGVRVESMTVDGKFRGYLATDRRGMQNHFFGSPFKGDASDMAFFKRVDFSAVGQAKCAAHPAQ